jgi:hypothetical protein
MGWQATVVVRDLWSTSHRGGALDLVDKRTFDGRLQMLECVPTVLDGPPGVGSES